MADTNPRYSDEPVLSCYLILSIDALSRRDMYLTYYLDYHIVISGQDLAREVEPLSCISCNG